MGKETYTPIDPADPAGKGGSAISYAENARVKGLGPLTEVGQTGNGVTTKATFGADGKVVVSSVYTDKPDKDAMMGPETIMKLREAIAAERQTLATDPRGRVPVGDLDRMDRALAAGQYTALNATQYDKVQDQRERLAARELGGMFMKQQSGMRP